MARVVTTVSELMGSGIVGVVTPASVRSALIGALDADGIAWTPELRPAAAPVVVLTPDDAKGLEFDSVVVVEPAAIVDESVHGLRALYVALTRCTNRLALVHARPLPAVLGLGPAAAPAPPETAETAVTAEPEVGTVVDETTEPEHRRAEPAEEAEALDEVEVDEVEVDAVEVDEIEVDEVEVDEVEATRSRPTRSRSTRSRSTTSRSRPRPSRSRRPSPRPSPSLRPPRSPRRWSCRPRRRTSPSPSTPSATSTATSPGRWRRRWPTSSARRCRRHLLPLVAAELVRMLEADGGRVRRPRPLLVTGRSIPTVVPPRAVAFGRCG